MSRYIELREEGGVAYRSFKHKFYQELKTKYADKVVSDLISNLANANNTVNWPISSEVYTYCYLCGHIVVKL